MTPSSISRDRLINILMYVAIAFPFFLYVRYVYVYALNIPRQDDFDAILQFVISFKKADLSSKLSLLFSQHNEHRILSSRFIYVLYYKLFGEINFRHLIFIDGFILFLLFLTISGWIRKALPGYWQVCVLVLSMCVFDLNNVENMNFAMGGMQNYGVILLFAGSMFFYGLRNNTYLIPAMLMQIVCVYSSGNGILGAAIVVLYNILSRNKVGSISSAICFLTFAPLYYYHYDQPGSNFFTLDPTKFLPFFLHTIGAHFSYTYGIYAALAMLIVLLINLPIGKRLNKEMIPLFCMIGFVLASVGVMSIFRGNLPVECSNASRYYIYPHLTVAITFVFFLQNLQYQKIAFLQRRNAIPLIAVLVVAGLCVSYRWNAYDGINGFKAFNSQLQTLDFDYPNKEHPKQVTEEACNENIYCIDKHRPRH